MLLTYRRPAGSLKKNKKMIGLEARFLDIIKEWSITLQVVHLFPNGISRRRRRERMEEDMSSWSNLDKLLFLWLFWSGKKTASDRRLFIGGYGWMTWMSSRCLLPNHAPLQWQDTLRNPFNMKIRAFRFHCSTRVKCHSCQNDCRIKNNSNSRVYSYML